MIGPNDLRNLDKENYNIENYFKNIDDDILKSHGRHVYEWACIHNIELPFHIRNQIAEKYLEAGWKYVYHHTSSELDCSKCYTVFYFSMFELKNAKDIDFSTTKIEKSSFRVEKCGDISALVTPIIVTKNGQDFSKED